MSSFQYNLARTELLNHLMSRRSHWPLKEPVPSAEELHLAFEAAMRAPDHTGRQPWRFVVVPAVALPALSDIFAEAAVNRGAEDGGKRSRGQALAAPMIVAVGARICRDCQVPEVEQILSVGAAAMNFLNALHILGYGGYWASGPNAYDRFVRESLGLHDEGDLLVGFIYVGSASKQRAPKARPSSEAFASTWVGLLAS